MRYILLIYGSEAEYAKTSAPEQQADFQAHGAYAQAVQEAGVMRGGEPLMPTHTATTVRVRNGKTVTTDGPFAETKEQLGGFYIVECANLDEAIAWAAKCPGAKAGSMEVRPIMEINM